MNSTLNAKLEALRLQVEAAFDEGEPDEAHTAAGQELAQALTDLQGRKADIDEEIAALEKAWSSWDYDWLAKKRYLSSSLIKKLRDERAASDGPHHVWRLGR